MGQHIAWLIFIAVFLMLISEAVEVRNLKRIEHQICVQLEEHIACHDGKIVEMNGGVK